MGGQWRVLGQIRTGFWSLQEGQLADCQGYLEWDSESKTHCNWPESEDCLILYNICLPTEMNARLIIIHFKIRYCSAQQSLISRIYDTKGSGITTFLLIMWSNMGFCMGLQPVGMKSLCKEVDAAEPVRAPHSQCPSWEHKCVSLVLRRQKLQVLDGPSCTLLDFMRSHDFQAPATWPGYRELTEK